MKINIWILCYLGILTATSCTKLPEQDKIDPVSLKNVTINDNFWKPMIERNRQVTMPYAFNMCKETGRIENFVVASGKSKNSFQGERYNDTDVFKIIEGAAYSLLETPDKKLEEYVDSLINIIAEAQESDGYLYTARSADTSNPAPGAGRDRWVDIWISHELYNAGHLYEAAVAYYKATGKNILLNVALKNADLVCREFGWGKREAAPGHQEVEIGLLKLYQVTGNKKYLDQARFFLDVRGRNQPHEIYPEGNRFYIYNNKDYSQQDRPILEQTEAKGHAVRATYMYTAMTMLVNIANDTTYLAKSMDLWKDVVLKKLYLTGGIGAIGEGEAFGNPYYLPNATAYNETCAAIGEVFWNYNLFLASGNSEYINVLERVLYNGLICGVSYDGKSFFYPNPLSSPGNYTRSPWFGVSCCPGNLTRFFPQVKGLIYASSTENLYINLFIASKAIVKLKNTKLTVEQTGNYPWNGEVKIVINPENRLKFNLRIRIPSWLNKSPVFGDLYSYTDSLYFKPEIRVNGTLVKYTIVEGYAEITRKWKAGDTVILNLPMPVRKVMANARVEDDRERIAVERGPIVYCYEECDNGVLEHLNLNKDFAATYEYNDTLLGGTGLLRIKDHETSLTAIPYYLWSNRSIGQMDVWIKTK